MQATTSLRLAPTLRIQWDLPLLLLRSSTPPSLPRHSQAIVGCFLSLLAHRRLPKKIHNSSLRLSPLHNRLSSVLTCSPRKETHSLLPLRTLSLHSWTENEVEPVDEIVFPRWWSRPPMVERGGEMVSIKLEITAIKKFNRLCEGGRFPKERKTCSLFMDSFFFIRGKATGGWKRF